MTGRRVLTAAGVAKEAVHEFLTDNCPHLAAAISYYFLLSLFPLILAAIAVFGLIMTSDEAEVRVTEAIAGFLPVAVDYIARIIHDVVDKWAAAGIVAVVGLLWAGTAVFNAVRKSLNTAWGIRQPRPFLHERLLEFVMMLGLGLLMLLSIGIATTSKIIREADVPVFGDLFLREGLLWPFIMVASGTTLAFLAFLFLYRVVPNTTVRWRHAFFGALAAAVLFEIVMHVFIWFTNEFITYSSVYGFLGSIVALMAWTYVTSLIMLFCAKLISVYPRMRASLAEQALAEANGELPPIEIREQIRARVKEKIKKPSASTSLLQIPLLTSGAFGLFRRVKLGRDQR